MTFPPPRALTSAEKTVASAVAPEGGAAVRGSYDTVAESYAELVGRGMEDEAVWERGVLRVFVESLAPGAVVGDLGCGTGRVAGYVRGLGASLVGVDISPGMLRVAARDHTQVGFAAGDMTRLPLASGVLGGALAWYSTVHSSDGQVDAMAAEFARVLAPGGVLCVAFKVGPDGSAPASWLRHAYGHAVQLPVYRRPVDGMSAILGRHGLVETARVVRQPVGQHEPTPQGFVLLRRAA
ncbi:MULTISPECIES: class I SAM-dependent methyltransferase [unclassified Streptomyces]|uniref:class I SAM-dependent methyltransferase n=1 Tax=unclassified Streptomyces TaxID=2593676 RepID=UPI001928576C|nr:MULTISPECIES: methyltransferase domain-containing protein [unclassified Streptomyces]